MEVFFMKSFSLFSDDSQKAEAEKTSSPSSFSINENSSQKPEKPTVAEHRAKSKTAYRTISEVAEELGVAAHVLRFWETKFKEVAPLTRSGGRRYYNNSDLEILKKVQTLLYDEGLTIKGVQAYLKKVKKGELSMSDTQLSSPALSYAFAEEMLTELKEIREILA